MGPDHPDSLEIDCRVEHILGLITRGEFVAGRTHRELAEKWGVKVERVSKLVTDAMRLQRLFRPSLEDDINRRLACIEEDRRLAASKVKHFAYKGEVLDERPAPDVASMIAADRLYLETIGALVRVKQRGDEGEDGPSFAELLKAELRANPGLARAIVSQLPPHERVALLSAGKEVVDASGDSEAT